MIVTQTAAVVLAGGASRRMGTPKALLPWGDVPLLAHVVRTLQPIADVVVVSVAAGQSLPELPAAVQIVPDVEPGQGPLEGFCAALQWLTAHRADIDQLFLTGCDSPLLTARVAQHVLTLLPGFDAAAPVVDGQRYPLLGAYKVSTVDAAQAQLTGGRRRFLDFVDRLQVRAITAEELVAVDPQLAALRSCNTPEEYRQAVEQAGLRWREW